MYWQDSYSFNIVRLCRALPSSLTFSWFVSFLSLVTPYSFWTLCSTFSLSSRASFFFCALSDFSVSTTFSAFALAFALGANALEVIRDPLCRRLIVLWTSPASTTWGQRKLRITFSNIHSTRKELATSGFCTKSFITCWFCNFHEICFWFFWFLAMRGHVAGPCLTLKHPDSQFQSLQIVDAQLRQLLRQVIFGPPLKCHNLLIKLLGDLAQRFTWPSNKQGVWRCLGH